MNNATAKYLIDKRTSSFVNVVLATLFYIIISFILRCLTDIFSPLRCKNV